MENKKYYWLKLKDDFFTDKRMKKLRKIAGGDTYTIIYLKMQLLSLQDEGNLYFENIEQTFEEEIALQIDEDIEDVKLTIAFLINNGLLIQNDTNEYELLETKNCIGSESNSKNRVQACRERQAIRDKIKLKYVYKSSNEALITLTDKKVHYFDNKRYGGNAEYVYDLAMCRCEYCGKTDTEGFVIYHNNGYSNDLEDLYLLCASCHRKVECGSIKELKHNRRNYENDLLENKSVTCNTNVTQCNTDIEKDIDINNNNTCYNNNINNNNININNKKEENKIKEEKKLEDLYAFIESNFNRTLSPIECSKINKWFNEYEVELIKYAIEKSVLNNAKKFNYVEAILNNWKSAGYKTINDIKEEENKIKDLKSEKLEELPEYDWLNE